MFVFDAMLSKNPTPKGIEYAGEQKTTKETFQQLSHSYDLKDFNDIMKKYLSGEKMNKEAGYYLNKTHINDAYKEFLGAAGNNKAELFKGIQSVLKDSKLADNERTFLCCIAALTEAKMNGDKEMELDPKGAIAQNFVCEYIGGITHMKKIGLGTRENWAKYNESSKTDYKSQNILENYYASLGFSEKDISKIINALEILLDNTSGKTLDKLEEDKKIKTLYHKEY
ncbi:MAG: hypothetical protein NTV88_05960 [Candidatus Micrarchaeota archaeon]|nr:hypothetical protein [Candidatus Micrarchaeota archaeon]